MKVKRSLLGDCIRITSGFPFEAAKFNDQRNGLPVVRIRDVVRGFSETYYLGDYPKTAELSNGDLLIGMDGEFNIAPWHGGLALLNQRVCKITPIDGIADAAYLKHALALVLKRIEAATPFVTVKHLSVDDLNESEIDLPSLAEQRRIAAQLEQADRLRRTRRYTLALSDTFLPATFRRMFGKPDNIVRLEDCAEIVSGIAKGQKYGERQTVSAPYLRVANVQDGFLDLSEIKFIEAVPEDVAELTLMPGDVLMTEGGDYDKLGRGAIWRGELSGCIHQNHVFRVRLDSEKVLPVFFAEFLRSSAAKSYFLSCAKQTTNLASINMTQLRATPLPVPPLTQQRAFAAVVREHERLRAVQRESLRQAEHLFQTLLHRAFVPA
ncbi:MAG: restriction endonuclease subunit S [Prosthecobacter sp.]|jgi:type I restriction enzyme S subunit